MEDALPDLDLSSALILLGDAISAHVLSSLDGSGLRHSHGYVIQRLLVAPATATEMAEALGISQQAVSKTLKELLSLGIVEPVTDPADRRRRPVQLTERGRRAVETARAARADLDQRLRAHLGDRQFAQTLTALTTALDALDLGDRVRRRAARPPELDPA